MILIDCSAVNAFTSDSNLQKLLDNFMTVINNTYFDKKLEEEISNDDIPECADSSIL